MSTTFEVWPRLMEVPKCGVVIRRIQDAFAERCYGLNINNIPEVKAEFHTQVDQEITKTPVKPNNDFIWYEKDHLRLYLTGCEGGTDAYFQENRASDIEFWRKDVIPRHNSAWSIPALQDCLDPGFHWTFYCRGVGATAILSAMAVGCLAEITCGAIFSYDGAWDYEKMPMTGSEAVRDLMRAHTAQDQYLVSEVERAMRKELNT